MTFADRVQLVGYPSMTPRDCARIHRHIGCQEEFRNKGVRKRWIQAWVSCSGGAGRLPVVRTPWVALSVASSVDPT